MLTQRYWERCVTSVQQLVVMLWPVIIDDFDLSAKCLVDLVSFSSGALLLRISHIGYWLEKYCYSPKFDLAVTHVSHQRFLSDYPTDQKFSIFVSIGYY